ncbi:serine/threonine-protein kinase [Actinorugispora endophytica]|uniref:Serine/threonine protein kinase n=1 Tax=Actinorugispora endophytica TaxID=1605990 RepID=A0A4R6V397_9ACTN|nr:serine/threonine-protein kinase [Actinorugispora endophytica]TDQ54875.1 serine/threonine protein kinase [Actinorugispora endophytica]
MPSDGLPKNLEPLAAGDPATIGPYMLAGRLGSGGMGTVYLGRSAEKGSHVAIKVIRPELAFDEATRARFRDEMENARRVASFCTAKVLDHGTFENRPYMVTEYIAGTALAEHIAKNGPLDSSTLHGFALGVAAALAAIHKAGLVHRDLKPANVLLSLSGPRVIDFGIARALNTVTNHTQTGIVMGSPGWMAPEQLLEEKVTTKADIFAWGCLVAFAGNGTHPFGNGDAMALGKRMLFAEPVIGDLDSPLDRLVAKALAKEPERRPSAQELLLELAGGSEDNDAGDANDMVSHALHQSWRPNLPPGPPGYPPQGHPPGAHQTLTGMRHPQAPPHPGQGPVSPQQPYPQGPPSSMRPPAAGGQGPPQQHQGQGRPLPQRPQQSPPQPPHHTGQFPVVPPHGSGGGQQPPGPPRQAPTGSHPQARPYVPPSPLAPHNPLRPDTRRSRMVVTAAIIGAVVLILLFSLFAVVAANGRLSLFGDDAPQGDQQEQPVDPKESEEPGSQAVPDEAIHTDNRMEFRIQPMECASEFGGVESPEGHQYCVFPVSVRNISGVPLDFRPVDQTLGYEDLGPDTPAESSVGGDDDELLWGTVEENGTRRGHLVFAVPNGREPTLLTLRGASHSSGVDIELLEGQPA